MKRTLRTKKSATSHVSVSATYESNKVRKSLHKTMNNERSCLVAKTNRKFKTKYCQLNSKELS